MRVATVLAMLVVLSTGLCAQHFSGPERDILTLQDQRSLGNGKLLSFLGDANPQVRYRALIALANIQDSSTASSAVPLLTDPDPKVRQAAAFALGQIGVRKYQDTLLSCIRQEGDSTVLPRMYEALGRMGGESALDQLVDDHRGRVNSTLAAEQALAVARFALRGVKSERGIWFCFDNLTSPNPEVRWMSLYALWRTAPHGLIDVEIARRDSVLMQLTSDPNVDVRLNLVILLGRSKSEYVKDLLRAAWEADQKSPNGQVEVQLVRTFAALSSSNPASLNDLTTYLSSPNDHVKIAALLALSGLSRQSFSAAVDTMALQTNLVRLANMKNPDAELTRGEAFVALAKLFPDEFARKNYMTEKDLTVRERTKVLEGLSLIPSGRSLSIIYYALDDPNVRVSMAAWDFVRRFFTPTTIRKIRSGDQEWGDARSTLFRKTMNSLARKDMAVTQLVATALADTSLFGIFKEGGMADSLVIALGTAFEHLASPDDVESMQAVIAAMGQIGDKRFVLLLEKSLNDPDKTVVAAASAALKVITGIDYSARIPVSTKALHTDYDWTTLESVTPSTRAVIGTSKGVITLRLLVDDAPFTVLSFVKLVKKKFYDGLSFHRVVPDFVIQGGDPRGDGWGGPGYAIRSEYSLVRFGRGMVGIASAGKDTEGCQFFITHVPTPHLDGRYTIFAQVVSGQDVVDRIQVGDTINSITIE